MKKYTFFIALALLSFNFFAQETSKFALGLNAGYNRGLGFQTNFTIFDFVKDTPIHLRFGLGYTSLNPGNAADARRIFINNATNGTPEKSGQSIDLRLDFLIPFELFNDSFISIGPRYSSFKGNYKFIGGNEFFDITSNQWGVGAGIGNFFEISNRLDLEINAGLDYYLSSTLSGHDTSYSPDDENINPRDDNQNDNIPFTYSDANEAIQQPQLMPRVMIGVIYKL
jgi:hypothetical protein